MSWKAVGQRSEVLALRWDDLDADGRTLRIDESLVAVNRGSSLGDAKNVRSRRLVPLSSAAVIALNRRTRDTRCPLGASACMRARPVVSLLGRRGRLDVLPL